jgi:hypothetical protein
MAQVAALELLALPHMDPVDRAVFYVVGAVRLVIVALTVRWLWRKPTGAR